MNAGAYDGEMKNIVSAVRAISPEGEIMRFSANELDFGYRHSIFQKNNCAICEVDLALTPGDAKEIEEKIAGFTERRESKQPLELPSAGSTFKRPEGYYAGTLIEQTGLIPTLRTAPTGSRPPRWTPPPSSSVIRPQMAAAGS